MHKCEDCGALFVEPKEYYEPDTGYRQLSCPYCGSDEYIESRECLCCGDYSDKDDYCEACMDDFDRCVDSIISAKIHPAEEVLASFYEGYPKDDDGSCMYCTGTNCQSCKDIVEAVIHVAVGTLGCDEDDIEGMARQKYCW